MPTKCDHSDTRISCSECNQPICSNCLVECPVGFRCKTCIDKVKSPLPGATPWFYVRTFGLCSAIGLGGGWIVPFINICWIGCFLCYFLGLGIGRWLANFLDYRLGGQTSKVIVFGVLFGMCFTPFGLLPLIIEELIRTVFGGPGITPFQSMLTFLGMIFSPVCFVIGILRPTIWGERW